jgi:hypothetical protein
MKDSTDEVELLEAELETKAHLSVSSSSDNAVDAMHDATPPVQKREKHKESQKHRRTASLNHHSRVEAVRSASNSAPLDVPTQPVQEPPGVLVHQRGRRRPASAGLHHKPRARSLQCPSAYPSTARTTARNPSASSERFGQVHDTAQTFSATAAGRLMVPQRWLHGPGESSYAAAFRASILTGHHTKGADTYVPREEGACRKQKMVCRSRSTGDAAKARLVLSGWNDSVVISRSMVYTRPKN